MFAGVVMVVAIQESRPRMVRGVLAYMVKAILPRWL